MRLMFAVLILGAGLPAAAQEFTPPRFEGLEQQQLNQEQRQFDELETRRQQELTRAAQPGVSPAQSALRRLEIQREADQLRREGQERRAATGREVAIREAKLPNRRIAAHSSLVVRDPERFALPAAPEGQYYARIDGRFVLVDATSEMVVRVLAPGPSGPRDDLPTEVLPEIGQGTALKPGVANSLSPGRAAVGAGCDLSAVGACVGRKASPLSDSGSTSKRR